jgi:hypothetical protein
MKKSLSTVLCCAIIVGVAVGFIEITSVGALTFTQQATVAVNVGINYGTAPIEWHNNTLVPSGQDLLNATMTVATVEFSTYPGLGAFVTSINGRSQDPIASLYWTFWVYNQQTQQYELPPVGASSYLLTSDQTIQWYYSSGTLGPGTSISISARLDTSTDPPTTVISGSIHPAPSAPVNVTLEYSQNQGGNYQEITRLASEADGTFSYSWKLPAGGMFMIRADASGMKSAPVSIGTSNGAPGFPMESMVVGSALGLLFLIVRRKQRLDGRISEEA